MKKGNSNINYDELHAKFFGANEPKKNPQDQASSAFDDSVEDLDFSSATGDFGDEFASMSRKISRKMKKKGVISNVIVPDDRKVIVEGQPVYDEGTLIGHRFNKKQARERDEFSFPPQDISDRTKISNIQIPSDREVTIEGGHTRADFQSLMNYHMAKINETEALFGKREPAIVPASSYGPSAVENIMPPIGMPVFNKAEVFGGKKQLNNVLIPGDRPVIVEGVSKFILSTDEPENSVRNIGTYKGKKLEKFILTINNQGQLDFNLELFNPSMPLDYLYSTSLNLNDKVTVAGASDISYSDVLFNLLANPTMIINGIITMAGANVKDQFGQVMTFKNKAIKGDEYVHPINPSQLFDIYQKQPDIAYFNIMEMLNRPYIPDGMDVIQYKVLAGMSVTLCFYYQQVSLKKLVFKEALRKKRLL